MTTFVSAQYVANDFPPPDQIIRAVDDKGAVWWLEDGSQNGDWLAYLDAGGTIEPAAVPVDSNILAAPSTLFGGPTVREALSTPSAPPTAQPKGYSGGQ
jgi:hypothetical protein